MKELIMIAKRGYEITLLELVDLLVYKGINFEGKDLSDALTSLEQIGLLRKFDSERGSAVKIL